MRITGSGQDQVDQVLKKERSNVMNEIVGVAFPRFGDKDKLNGSVDSETEDDADADEDITEDIDEVDLMDNGDWDTAEEGNMEEEDPSDDTDEDDSDVKE